MALTTQSASIGGTTKTLIVGADGSGNLAAAHVNVDASGVEKGIVGNPLSIVAASLPLPTGAAQDGTDASGVTPPTGAAGVRGWLSGIYSKLSGTLTTAISGSVAVTGTFWQATQPVSGTVTANAGTGTMAVSAAALPLPTGAATAAKQPALGTAGSASADVISVQGIAGGVAQSVTVTPASVSAMTTASVTTTSAQVLAARSGRKRLSFQNTGAGTVTLLFGSGTATVGGGIIMASGGSANSQGGAWEEPAHECWAGAVQAIGSAASTLTIIEG